MGEHRRGSDGSTVVPEVEGAKVEPRDAKGLAWSMRRLSADPALQRRLSDNARKAADALGIDEYAPRIVEVYLGA